MMKFFRKYMKHLLAIFMALLLVVWLGGSALTDALRKDDRGFDVVQGEAFGKTVKHIDMLPAFNDTDYLSSLGLPWQVIHRGSRTEPINAHEWFMLDLAARKTGIYIPREDVVNIRTQIPYLDAVRQNRKLSLEEIDRCIESYLRINEMAISAASAVKASDADINNFIRDIYEKVRVNIISLKAKEFVDDSYEPAEEEIKEQFEQYKNVASQPANTLEFGYQVPEKTQIEYIKVKVDALKGRQDISNDDAFKYWQEHKTEFLKPTTQPTTQPQRDPPQPYTTFTEARPDVLKKLGEEKAKAEAQHIARELISQLKRPWAESPSTGPYDYREPPESETADDIYPKLITRVESKYSGILEYSRSKSGDAGVIQQIKGLGNAMVLPGTEQRVPFGVAAFMAGGLEANPKDDPQHTRFYRNLHETCAEPATDRSTGDTYVFRNVSVEPKRPPTSHEIVRERIVKDIRLQRAYEEAGKQANILAEQAGRMGLQKALDGNPELKKKLDKQAFKELQPFSRKQLMRWGQRPQLIDGYIPSLGVFDPEFAKKCFAAVNKKAASKPAATKPTTTQPTDILVHERKDRQQWIVAESVEKLCVTQAEYDKDRKLAKDFILNERRRELWTHWFSTEQIQARIDWKRAEPEIPEAQTEDKEETEGETEEEQET
ncbi:MAG: hypothetical protein ACYTF1_11270 [Planctomycetota bacterium]|jgi:hypothetical protein